MQDNNVYKLRPSEVDSAVTLVRSLRDEVSQAWRERAVVLSKSEQEVLRAEIADACDLLTHLTQLR